MQKTETVDLPVPRSLKEELEEAARSRHTSVADLLEQIVREWLARSRGTKEKVSEESDEEYQQRIRAAAAPFIGSIQGGDLSRSENVRAAVRVRWKPLGVFSALEPSWSRRSATTTYPTCRL